MNWRSIDEEAAEAPVVLRGILATVPQSYDRFARTNRLTAGGVASFLRRVIAWSAAGMLHLILGFLLLAFYLDLDRESETLVWARLYRGDAGEEGKLVEAPKFEAPKEEPKPEPPPPEPPKPEPPKPEPPPEPPKPVPEAVKPPDPGPPKPAANPVEGPPAAEPRPATIGTGASATGPAAKSEITEGQIERNPTEALRQRRAGQLTQLQRGGVNDVVVVGGSYDRVEDVLARLTIPFTAISPESLAKEDLSRCKILLINCHSNYASYLQGPVNTKGLERQIESLIRSRDELEARMERTKDKKTLYRLNVQFLATNAELGNVKGQLDMLQNSGRIATKLQDFVARGGYLFTGDWGISLLEVAFPGHVKNGGMVGPRTVGIRPKSGKEAHPLLDEVFFDRTASLKKIRWEVDGQTYMIRVTKPSVEVLVESPEISKCPAVAVTFQPDGAEGKVLHVLSHFQKQATKHGDYAMQNLLLNFLLERVSRLR